VLPTLSLPLPTPEREIESESEIMDWRHKAACLDEDPELFFPVGTTGPALDQVERAKAVCRQCDVTAQCLEWALETNQDAGVWGGMSEDERRTLRRSRQRRRRIAS
jgi:WhiB family redox-sensing transcriptional regulator